MTLPNALKVALVVALFLWYCATGSMLALVLTTIVGGYFYVQGWQR
jgi:hypothetical protein